MTNLNLLWIDKKTNKDVIKSIYSYSKSDRHTQIYFIEWLYKHHIKIRVKMSKNQRNKYVKYDKIPSLPSKIKNISNFGIIKYHKKPINKKQRDKQGFMFKIGESVYKINILKGIDKFSSKDEKILKQLFFNSILY